MNTPAPAGRLLLLILLCVVWSAVLGVAHRARADYDNPQMRLALPTPLREEQWARIALEIPLSPEQSNALQLAWHDYLAATQALEPACIEATTVPNFDVRFARLSAKQWEDRERTIKRLRSQLIELENALFRATERILAEAQQAKLNEVRWRRQFDAVADSPLLWNRVQAAHLDDALRPLTLTPAVAAQLEPILDRYRAEMPALLESVAGEALELQVKLAVEMESVRAAQLDPWHGEGHDIFSEHEARLARPLRTRIRRLLELERSTCSMIRSNLDIAQQRVFDAHWLGRRYRVPTCPSDSHEQITRWLRSIGIEEDDPRFERVMHEVDRAVPSLDRLAREQAEAYAELEHDALMGQAYHERYHQTIRDFHVRRMELLHQSAREIRAALGLAESDRVLTVRCIVHHGEPPAWWTK